MCADGLRNAGTASTSVVRDEVLVRATSPTIDAAEAVDASTAPTASVARTRPNETWRAIRAFRAMQDVIRATSLEIGSDTRHTPDQRGGGSGVDSAWTRSPRAHPLIHDSRRGSSRAPRRGGRRDVDGTVRGAPG